jgi:hypothetical protein
MKGFALLSLMTLCAVSARAQNEDGDLARPALVSPGGLNLFYDIEGPLSFVTQTPRDLPRKRVEAGDFFGRSCQRGFSIPISLSLRPTSVSAAGGDGGFLEALRSIRVQNPTLAGLYDVRVDIQTFSILGIYRKTCTEVAARGYL